MKKTGLFLIAALTLVSYAATAQTLINITENKGITTKELHEVHSITFMDGNLRLNLITDDVEVYSLYDVRKIDFSNTISSIEDELPTFEATAIIYPNPSSGNVDLNLIFKSELQSQAILSIYGLDGMLRKQYTFAPNDGFVFPFQVNNMPAGMYIAVIQQGHLVKSEKLIIN